MECFHEAAAGMVPTGGRPEHSLHGAGFAAIENVTVTDSRKLTSKIPKESLEDQAEWCFRVRVLAWSSM